jgi:hypothetical protein
MARRSFFAGIIAPAVAIVGCGETPAPADPTTAAVADPVEPARPRAAASKGPRLEIKNELGSIDRAGTEATLTRLVPSFNACHAKGVQRMDYLQGRVAFVVRVGGDGKAVFAYVEDADLGDRETERCLLDAMKAASWPKPEGGDAEVRKSLEFDTGDVRPAVPWEPTRITGLVEAGDLHKCKEGTSAKFRITAYVEPHGNAGKVHAVGVSTSSADGEAKADCIVRVVRGWKVPSPGSYAAKVSFDL